MRLFGRLRVTDMAVVVLATALLICALTFGIWATFTKNSALFGRQTALAGIYSLVLAAIVAAVAMTGWGLRRSRDTRAAASSGTDAWQRGDHQAQSASVVALESQAQLRRSSVVSEPSVPMTATAQPGGHPAGRCLPARVQSLSCSATLRLAVASGDLGRQGCPGPDPDQPGRRAP